MTRPPPPSASLATVLLATALLAPAAEAAPGAVERLSVTPARLAVPQETTLVITLCAEDAPTQCDVQRSPLYDAPALCLMPPQLRQFSRPGWRIARWRCEPGG